jgi:hypothetical protein
MEKNNVRRNSASCQDAAEIPQNDYSNIENCNNQETLSTNLPESSFPVLHTFLWAGLFILAIAVSLAGQTIISYQPYALSEFNAHSMLSVIGTIQYILYVQLLYLLVIQN